MMTPNLNKPRITEIKGKVIEYKELSIFKKKHPEYKDITISKILNVVRKFHENIIDETMLNIYGVLLPENMGWIFLNNVGKPKKKAIDFYNSKLQNKVVYHKNWDTDNNTVRITYLNNTARNTIQNTHLFTFTALQSYKRKAGKHFKKNWQRCLSMKPQK
jgi:hypothetical protein